MELTDDNVQNVFIDCLFNEDENTDDMIKVEGIINIFGFHPKRLESHRDDVMSMLKQLPEEFMASTGGGWSFLNACMRKDGVQWTGLHRSQEQLFVLGIGLGIAEYLLSRDMWKLFPGSVPYVRVNDKED